MPGEALCGRKKLSAETGLSEWQVRTALKKLEKTGEITIKPTNKYSIIKLHNWHKYQDEHQQAANKSPSTHQQPTTNNNVNNNDNDNKEQKQEQETSNKTQALTKKPENLAKAHFELAEFLIHLIAQQNPAFQQKNKVEAGQPIPESLRPLLLNWAAEMEELCRIDQAHPEQIRKVIEWLYSGKTKNSLFWSGHILDARKFREKYQQLVGSALTEHASLKIDAEKHSGLILGNL